MLATALLTGALAACAPQSTDGFTTKSANGITVRHDASIEIAAADLDAILSALQITREVANKGLGVQLPFEPLVTIRRHRRPNGAYSTDGVDKIDFAFPSEHYVARLQLGDEKVVRYALPCYVQLFLYRSLTSTAGLDPRILESIADYGMWLYKREVERMTPTVKAPEQPTGLGLCWYQLDTYYEGTTFFLMSNLSALKVPGHLLGQKLRDLAVAATTDPQVNLLFDSICPPEPLLAAEELEPSAPLIAASRLRTGRAALFNGVPLLDVEGDLLTVAERMTEFDQLFTMAIMIAPDNRLRREPPALRDIDIWKLWFEYRPRVLAARDNFDYFLVLREFFSRFEDRAMGLMPSPALPVPPGSPYWSSVSGLKFARSGERIFVARVSPGSAPEKAGVAPGLEVLSIDGRPARRTLQLLADVARAFDSCPSRQRAEIFALDMLLTGARGSTCKLVLRDPAAPAPKKGEDDPAVVTHELARGLPPDPKAPPPSVELVEPMRADGIAVVRVHQFAGDALARFAGAIDECNKLGAKGLVIDLRGNEGMTLPESRQRTSSAMLGRLLPVDSPRIAIGSAVQRVKGEFDRITSTEIVIERAPGVNPFGGRIAVLTDGWTGGEAEWFVLGVRLAKIGIVVGQRTAGSVTAPKAFEPQFQSLAASKIDVGFPLAAVFRPDGSLLQTIGIEPNFEIEPDPADLAAGRDTMIEHAASLLLQSP